jgi:hypothetical protein
VEEFERRTLSVPEAGKRYFGIGRNAAQQGAAKFQQFELETAPRACGRHGGDARGTHCDEGPNDSMRNLIEEDAVRTMKSVGLSVVCRNPICIRLGCRVGTSRVKRCFFGLRIFYDSPVEF